MIKTSKTKSGTSLTRSKRNATPKAKKATPKAKRKSTTAVQAATAKREAKAKAKREAEAMATTKQLAKGKLSDHALSVWRLLKAKGKLSCLTKGQEDAFCRVVFNVPKGLAPEDAQTKASEKLLPFVRKQNSRIANVAVSSATAAINKGEREVKYGYYPSGDITQDGGVKLTKRVEIVRSNANKADLMAILNADKDKAFEL